MTIDQPRDQRVATPVQTGQLLRQVEPRADAPDPPVLDPHVLVALEGLAIEDRDVHDREVLLVNPLDRALRDLRHRQRREHADEHHDPGHEPGQAAAPKMVYLHREALLIEKLPARRNPNAATARKTRVSAPRTKTCSATDCPASMAMTLSASCAW